MSQFMWKCLAQCLHITYNQLRLVESDSPGEARIFGEYFKGNKKEDNHVFFIKWSSEAIYCVQPTFFLIIRKYIYLMPRCFHFAMRVQTYQGLLYKYVLSWNPVNIWPGDWWHQQNLESGTCSQFFPAWCMSNCCLIGQSNKAMRYQDLFHL